jgi:hypothetical protein
LVILKETNNKWTYDSLVFTIDGKQHMRSPTTRTTI